MLGEEPGVRGGARCYGRRAEDVFIRKKTYHSHKPNPSDVKAVHSFRRKKRTHFATNNLTDGNNNKVSKAAQL